LLRAARIPRSSSRALSGIFVGFHLHDFLLSPRVRCRSEQVRPARQRGAVQKEA
jgi:hypothetical protein